MVNEGFLPQKELIFHLTIKEIQNVIKTRNSRIIQNAIRRKKVYDKPEDLKFPEVVFGVPKPLSDNDENIVEGDVLVRG